MINVLEILVEHIFSLIVTSQLSDLFINELSGNKYLRNLNQLVPCLLSTHQYRENSVKWTVWWWWRSDKKRAKQCLIIRWILHLFVCLFVLFVIIIIFIQFSDVASRRFIVLLQNHYRLPSLRNQAVARANREQLLRTSSLSSVADGTGGIIAQTITW